MLCILYVNMLGGILGVAARLVEALLPSGVPRRWVWCLAIALSVSIPSVYQAKHAAPVETMLARAPVIGHAGASSISGLWSRDSALARIIGPAWIIASSLLIMLGLSEAWRVARRLQASCGMGARHELDVDGVSVVVSDTLGPATVGVRRPRVVLPRWVLALPPAERSFVVRHEEEHRRANDTRLLWVSTLTLILLPWNIPLWWQLRRLSLAVETDCDQRVVSALGNVRAYGELLLKVASASGGRPSLQPGFVSGPGAVEQRIAQLVGASSTGGLRRAFSLMAVASLLYLAFMIPHPTSKPEAASVTTAVRSHHR
jgi:bla regulator protein blaR1